MKISEFTRSLAEEYRQAKAAYFDATVKEDRAASYAFSYAAERLASAVLLDIDEAEDVER